MGPAPFAPRSAFTLIEMLLALAVIGLIAALVIPAMGALKWEAAGERAQAEVVGAFSDARSLARGRSNPVVVTLRVAADGTHELWGAVLDAANLGPLPGAENDDEPDAPAPTMAGKRLAVLPERCVLGAPKAAEGAAAEPESAAPAAAELPEPLQLAVVFPDGTAMAPVTPVVLTVPQGVGKPDAVYRLTINPWFAEVRFARVEPPKPGDAETSTDAPTGPDGAGEVGAPEPKATSGVRP